MAHNVYYVSKHPKGGWNVKKPDASKGRVFPTKAEAVDEAHRMAAGGVVHIEGPRGFVKCPCSICK